MRIHFHATLRDVVGGRDPDLPVADGTTVAALLGTVVTRWPEARAKLFDADGTLYRNVHVMVNGRDARWLPDGLATRIREGDGIDVFPAVGGG